MKTILSVAALGAALAVTPASAPASAPERSATINYSDLNLRDKVDVARLEGRIRAAIRDICGTSSDADPKGKNAVRACKNQTRAAAARARDGAISRAETRSFAEK